MSAQSDTTQVQLGSKRPATKSRGAGESTHGIGQIFKRMDVDEWEQFRDGEVSAGDLLARHGFRDPVCDSTTETSIEDFGGSQ